MPNYDPSNQHLKHCIAYLCSYIVVNTITSLHTGMLTFREMCVHVCARVSVCLCGLVYVFNKFSGKLF